MSETALNIYITANTKLLKFCSMIGRMAKIPHKFLYMCSVAKCLKSPYVCLHFQKDTQVYINK